MAKVIVIVGDDGLPLQPGPVPTQPELEAMGRSADLLMAFQWGQEAVQGDYKVQLQAFESQFAGDAEARAKFDAGVAAITHVREASEFSPGLRARMP